jgi:hypothetical protein
MRIRTLALCCAALAASVAPLEGGSPVEGAPAVSAGASIAPSFLPVAPELGSLAAPGGAKGPIPVGTPALGEYRPARGGEPVAPWLRL